jgi:hypothetical protein
MNYKRRARQLAAFNTCRHQEEMTRLSDLHLLAAEANPAAPVSGEWPWSLLSLACFGSFYTDTSLMCVAK